MTKLKCWKKVGDFDWKNKKGEKSISIQYYSAHPDITIHQFDYKKSLDEGGMKQIGKDSYYNMDEAKSFVKKYMKEHDKC